MVRALTNKLNLKRRAQMWVLLAAYYVTGAVTAFFAQSKAIAHLDRLPQVCPLKIITSLKCAFCGMTHAWIYFWHADFKTAFEQNVLSIPLFVLTPATLIVLSNTQPLSKKQIQIASMAMMATLAVYTVARNL